MEINIGLPFEVVVVRETSLRKKRRERERGARRRLGSRGAKRK